MTQRSRSLIVRRNRTARTMGEGAVEINTAVVSIESDIEIAQAAQLRPIRDVALEAGLQEDELELYGRYKAKVLPPAFERMRDRTDGKLVILTCMTPPVAGAGKTTTRV